MSFLDCHLLETVVEKLPQLHKLITRVKHHIQIVSFIGNNEALLRMVSTALMKTVANGQNNIAELLLSARGNLNHQRHDGNTPLHVACLLLLTLIYNH